ncbi:hypothetical protein AUC69_11035 [Methyloceanibacter superfactus]|jgi:hypothetical protein|uniref:Uncharacterized protein n=1 Tax=Methyloceanibacter superfactus TaxID=1774969 RepID=A0A1E3VVS8_9HYPH|nr:hypothetical protein [Methyloceanibacter superfactus]ODR97637.1 hypothetical protein AUC69_11035 [Methyloceanibacter superfactus]
MSLYKIRLELARDHDFPDGSSAHGYEFTAPLSDDGHIDHEAWKGLRDRCRVRRFWEGDDDEVGHLIRKPGGSWALHYDLLGDADDDESGYRFGDHVFRQGEYVSIKEHDDQMRTFKVVMVQPLQ